MKTEIQLLKPNDLEDFKSLILVFEIVFEMEKFQMPTDKYLQGLLQKENFFALTAKIESKIIGGLTGYILDQYYSERPLTYIYDLGVLPEYQRKGIGKSLIEFTREFSRGKSVEEIYVQVDYEDKHAIDFYRSTIHSSQNQVFHFSYIL